MSRAPRGRGRGGGSASNAKILLKRTAQEAGLDDRHLTTLEEITHPKLFPDLLWHSSGRGGFQEDPPPEDGEAPKPPELVESKRPAGTVYFLNKQRELNEALQQSSHYVFSQQQRVVDVIRYNKRNRQLPADEAVLESMGALAYDSRYTPSELLTASKSDAVQATGGTRTMNGSGGGRRRSSLEELEQRERSGNVPQRVGSSTLPAEEETAPEEDDEEEAEDYTKDYYESEDESDGGEAEPTF